MEIGQGTGRASGRRAAVGGGEPDGAACLADYRRRIEDLRGRAERAQAEIAGLSATATSPDGAVRATVGASGRLTALVLGPPAAGMSRERLAELVVATVAAAGDELSRRADAALAPLLT